MFNKNYKIYGLLDYLGSKEFRMVGNDEIYKILTINKLGIIEIATYIPTKEYLAYSKLVDFVIGKTLDYSLMSRLYDYLSRLGDFGDEYNWKKEIVGFDFFMTNEFYLM